MYQALYLCLFTAHIQQKHKRAKRMYIFLFVDWIVQVGGLAFDMSSSLKATRKACDIRKLALLHHARQSQKQSSLMSR